MNNIKAVFFDAGNTLIYAYPSVPQIYSDISKTFGADVSAKLFEDQVIPVFRDFTSKLHTRPQSSDPSEKQLWRDITFEIYNKVSELNSKVEFLPWFETLYYVFGTKEVWRVFDDVHSVLAWLKSNGIKCGLISNWDSRLRGILEAHGLSKMLDHIFISAEIGYRKPAPGIFEISLAKSGLRPEEVLYVGDQYDVDVLGAKKAGIGSFLLSRDGSQPHISGVKTITGLPEILNELGA